MTIIEKTRELGVMIQQDERYIAYNLAKDANDADEELQEMINNFNLLRMNMIITLLVFLGLGYLLFIADNLLAGRRR